MSTTLPVFSISSERPVSETFRKHGIHTFVQACEFVKQLPFRRNSDKNNLLTVFSESCGTCGSKHALLYELARENGFINLALCIGIYKMNAVNSPGVKRTLAKNRVEFVPEAHCYLRYKNEVVDLTTPAHSSQKFLTDLLEEIKIQPDQISDFKVSYQKKFIENWLRENPDIPYTLTEFWNIREMCIAELSGDFVP